MTIGFRSHERFAPARCPSGESFPALAFNVTSRPSARLYGTLRSGYGTCAVRAAGCVAFVLILLMCGSCGSTWTSDSGLGSPRIVSGRLGPLRPHTARSLSSGADAGIEALSKCFVRFMVRCSRLNTATCKTLRTLIPLRRKLNLCIKLFPSYSREFSDVIGTYANTPTDLTNSVINADNKCSRAVA